jgi:hypothetical protein
LDPPKQYFDAFELQDRLPTRTLAVISLYAKQNNIPVTLGDVPETVYRGKIGNPNTLV